MPASLTTTLQTGCLADGQAADLRSDDDGCGFCVCFVSLDLQAGLQFDGEIPKRHDGEVIFNREHLGKALPFGRPHLDPGSARGDEFFHGFLAARIIGSGPAVLCEG